MALIDNQQIMTTLLQMNDAKRIGDRDLHSIYKQQFRNNLLQYQLDQSTSALKETQSAYEKQQQSYKELQEKIDVHNRTMEIFGSQKGFYDAHPYAALGQLGVDPDVVEIARDRSLYQNLTKQYPHLAAPLGVAQLGGADAVQEASYFNQGFNQGAINPLVQQNYQVPAIEAQAAQTTANANMLQQQTAAANSPMAMLDRIYEIYPTDSPQRRAAIMAQFGGTQQAQTIAAMSQILSKEQLQQAMLGVAGVSDPVQNVNAGVPAYPPPAPKKTELTPTQKGQAAFEEEKARFIASAKAAGRSEEYMQNGLKQIADKYGEFKDPKTSSAGTGVSTIDKELADGAVQIFNSLVSKGFSKGESKEYGHLATLLAFNRLLKTYKTLNSDPTVLAKRFIASLGEAIKTTGTENQTVAQQALVQLAQNNAELGNLITNVAQMASAKGGGYITLRELLANPATKPVGELITAAVMSSSGYSTDPTLLSGIVELVGGQQVYNRIVEEGRKAAAEQRIKDLLRIKQERQKQRDLMERRTMVR